MALNSHKVDEIPQDPPAGRSTFPPTFLENKPHMKPRERVMSPLAQQEGRFSMLAPDHMPGTSRLHMSLSDKTQREERGGEEEGERERNQERQRD